MFQISNNELKILNLIKTFIFKIDNMLENIPRKDTYYKDKTREILYEMLETVFNINYIDENNLLLEYKMKLKSYIALIDFLLERLYNKKYINENNLYKLGIDLFEINKMATAWVNNKCKLK